MKKQWVSVALGLSIAIGGSPAGAEQPAAETYRQMFRSGTFCVEYKDEYTSRILAEENGQRMERTSYNIPGWVTFLNPLGALFGGSGPKHPEIMYKDGNYYQFTEDNRAIVLSKEHLADENLDPRQGWNGIDQKLALPVELAIFFWKDPYREKTPAIAPPEFVASSRKLVDGKEYDCDRYACAIKRADGGGDGDAKLLYDALYDEKGQLVEIQSLVLLGGTEYPNNRLRIKRILPEVPKGSFAISKKTKIYAAGNGDMNDLLDQPVQVGQMEGLK